MMLNDCAAFYEKTERIYGLRTLLHTLNLIVICVPLLVQAEEVRPGVLRTPDSRFENLPTTIFPQTI